MKYIDIIVDFIFDKIIQSNKMEVLQPPKEEPNFIERLRDNFMAPSRDNTSNTSAMNATEGISISKKPLEKRNSRLSIIKKTTTKFHDQNGTNQDKSNATNLNSSGTPRFIPDGEVSIIRNTNNTQEEEFKEQDLSSIVKNLRKKYDSSLQSKKGGERKTLKEIILNKTKTRESPDYSGRK
jgi:hypothetical protein